MCISLFCSSTPPHFIDVHSAVCGTSSITVGQKVSPTAQAVLCGTRCSSSPTELWPRQLQKLLARLLEQRRVSAVISAMLLLSIACYSVLLFSGVAVRSRSQPTQAQSLTPADTTFDKQLTSRRYSAHGESRRIETRALQQVAAAEYVTTVSTAEELVEAVARGDAHIELQAHVDLTALEESSSAFLLGDAVPGSVQSITVRC